MPADSRIRAGWEYRVNKINRMSIDLSTGLLIFIRSILHNHGEVIVG
jgi:hypothetical protein